ncbi:MAG: type II toxin-antitoxin system VapB family antitoxin [Acidobacteria bacterium]|nr:MAG: type II toxin-antitoxin system VapB family antitoxin [Acidobacteriota bacterium]
MRTHLDIDEDLLRTAVELGGCKNRTEAVRAALQAYVRKMAGRRLLELRGKVKWEGDLDELRRDRFKR